MRGTIPPKAIEVLGRISRWMITDAGVFLILGMTFFSKGIIYLAKDVPRFSEHVLETNLPQGVLGGLWVFFGILMVCGCFIKNTYYQSAMAGLSVGTLMLWGLEFFKYDTLLFLQYGIVHLALSAMTLYTIARGRKGDIRISKTSVPPLEIVNSSGDAVNVSKDELNGN